METRPDRGDDLLDLLYPEEADGGGAGEGADLTDDDRRELDRLRELRGVLREVREASDAEPPALDDVLAAAREQAKAGAKATAVAAPGGGLWARVRGWFQVMAAHPAMAAAATVVLVAGAAGVLYVNGRGNPAPEVTAPATSGEAKEAATEPAAGGQAAQKAPGGAAEDGDNMGAAMGSGSAAGNAEADDTGVARDEDESKDKAQLIAEEKPSPERRERPTTAHHAPAHRHGPVRGAPSSGTFRATGGGGGGATGGDTWHGDFEGGSKGTGAAAPASPAPPPPPPPPAPTAGHADRGPAPTTSTLDTPKPSRAPARPAPAAEPAPAEPPAAVEEAPEAVSQPDKKDEIDATERAARLTQQAVAAAKQKACARVRALAIQVRTLSLGYYRARFEPNPDIARNCAAALK